MIPGARSKHCIGMRKKPEKKTLLCLMEQGLACF